MEVYFYQAECGDAARIRFFDKNNTPRNIIIDSGYEKTFNHILKSEIKQLIDNDERIDLCIISHIHDDHIGGVIKYIKTILDGELVDIIDNWFYNSPRNYQKDIPQDLISFPQSISQGDFLFNYINSIGKSLKDITSDNIKIVSFNNLQIIVLSPSETKLFNLREKYKSEDLMLEKIEDDSISEAVSISEVDYYKKVEDFNLENWKEDISKENGSSISVITEFNNKKILWLADSHPTDIVNSLNKLGYSKSNKLKCEWVKVSHHGSSGNNSDELYSLIESTNYLMSVNGENRHKLPKKESLVRILRNKNRDINKKYIFHFTYDNSTLRSIFEIDGDSVFEKWNFEIKYLKNSKYLKIII